MPLRKQLLNCFRVLIALAALVPGMAPAAVPTLEVRLLTAHNRERLATGVDPLRWNARLAVSAAQWAKHLAANGRFEHAPINPVDDQGENLWAGTPGHFSPEQMVAAWVAERRDFSHGPFPATGRGRNGAMIGHYTQVVWRDTEEVGCAIAKGQREDVLVCRYSNPGNVIGEMPY